ncbi:MAG: 6-phosphogluconolactonase [Planctomycetota bacterium]|jgi:6-phosphogluconolactonase
MKAINAKLNVSLVPGYHEIAQEMLDLFTSEARKAIDISGRFCTAISRYTPRIFFELLGSDFRSKSLPWDRIHLFCVDECCSSYDPGINNYILATKSLAEQVDLPSENVHRICSKCSICEHTASIYEQTLYDVIGREDNKVPRFDLILLKMAPDGHIASLFPDTYTFFESQKLAQVSYFMDARHTRITLTHSVLYAASRIAVFVSGGDKAEILSEIFTHEPNIAQYPIHALWPVLDKVTWLVDNDAARFLLPPLLYSESA